MSTKQSTEIIQPTPTVLRCLVRDLSNPLAWKRMR